MHATVGDRPQAGEPDTSVQDAAATREQHPDTMPTAEGPVGAPGVGPSQNTHLLVGHDPSNYLG